MSNTLPPSGPEGPEYLQQGGGAPRQPGPPSGSPDDTGGGRARRAAIAGGAVAAVLLVGGGIWAATSFFGSGAQPAEALPDTTLGYVSIDLDPSGGQKIEAIRTLRKFPAFKEQIGLDTTDDLREKLFEEIQKEDPCEGLDYADDIEPWLGDRAAVAAVDTGEDQPSPVLVLQVKDADKADDGLNAIKDCGSDDSGGMIDAGAGDGGWVIEGDWVVIGESEAVAQSIVDDAADAPLSDDADYQRWTDEVGDAGIINVYAAPAAGAYLADNLDSLGMLSGGVAGDVSCVSAPGDTQKPCDDGSSESTSGAPSEISDALKDFEGMAATIRFADGALELEVASDPGMSQDGLYATDRGDNVLATLPDDTAAALGVGLDDGWFGDLMDQVANYSGGETSADDLLADLSDQSGLDLPGDAETLAGEAFAVGIGNDFDPDAFANGTGLSELPIAAKVKGDPSGIDAVLDKLRPQLSSDEQGALDLDADGDLAAIGPNADYRGQVLEDGGLGDSDVFQDVVPDASSASAIFFVNFDAGDGWLTNLVGDDQEVVDNLEPLSGFGVSAWSENGAAHALVRITTE